MYKIYKVIGIPDSTRILINAGKRNSNIQLKDKVEIFENTLTITDPDTNEDLMPYGIAKETLVVTKVYEEFSELRNVKELMVGVPNFSKILNPLLSSIEIEYKNIDAEHENIQNSSKHIKKGDFCRIIYEK